MSGHPPTTRVETLSSQRGWKEVIKTEFPPTPYGLETSPISAVPPANNSLSLLCGKRSESVATVQPCPLS